jgi:hypothetical protein
MIDFAKHNLQYPLIHIGFPRSASTWLQTCLFQPEQGFPQIMDPVSAHMNFIESPVFTFRPEKVEKWMAEKIGASGPKWPKGATPVITQEGLAGKIFGAGYNGKEIADRIKTVLPEGKILIVIREQKAILLSLYNLYIKWGLPHSLGQLLNPIEPRIAPQFKYVYLHYHLIVSYYQGLFGKDKVLVLPFEQFISQPDSFARSIFEFSGNMEDYESRLNRLPFKTKVNASEPFMRLKWQRWVNYMFITSAFNYSGLIKNRERSWLMKILNQSMRVFDHLPERVHQRAKKKAAAFIEKESRGKFADSNRALEDLIQMDLSPYGYEK